MRHPVHLSRPQSSAAVAPRPIGPAAEATVNLTGLQSAGHSLLAAVDLAVADVCAFLLCAALSVALRGFLRGPSFLPAGLVPAGALWICLRLFAQLYPGYGLAPPEELRAATLTTILAALVHGAVLFSFREAGASRLIALTTWFILIAVSWFLRGFVKGRLIGLGFYGTPVVVIGASETAALVIRELRNRRELGYVPVASFSDESLKQRARVEGVPVIGSVRAALECTFPVPVRHAVLAMPEVGREEYRRVASELLERYPHLAVVPDLLGMAHLWVRARALGTCLALEVQNNLLDPWSLLCKRIADLALAVPLLLLAMPFILLASAAVKLISPGPAFFCQEREGLHGRRIHIWKVRTMVPDAEARLEEHLCQNPELRAEWNERMKLRDDPRIIPLVGRLLRRFSLDELPQLWNVLKGEMSLVGPRAFTGYHLVRFSDEFRALRRRVHSGMTGLWQVTIRSEGDLKAQEDADSYYIRNWSLWLDLWILLRTVRVILRGEGAY